MYVSPRSYVRIKDVLKRKFLITFFCRGGGVGRCNEGWFISICSFVIISFPFLFLIILQFSKQKQYLYNLQYNIIIHYLHYITLQFFHLVTVQYNTISQDNLTLPSYNTKILIRKIKSNAVRRFDVSNIIIIFFFL